MECFLLNLNIFLTAIATGLNSVPIYYYFFPIEIIEYCGR